MRIVRKAKQTKRIEHFRSGEVFKCTISNNLYMKVDDTEAERDECDVEAAVNLSSGELVYFEYTDEFIPVDCEIILEE